MKRWPGHLISLAALLGLAVLHTWPLAREVGHALPGTGLGDNAVFVWNFWWMREALGRSDVSFFRTAYQFAPVGADLVLHTHTALVAFIGATLLAGVRVLTALNVVLLISVFLNGASAYALAFEVTRHRLSAFLAGILFLLAPPLFLRLMGHFGLVLAWTMVGAMWLVIRMDARGRRAVAAGIAVGLVAYADYYFFVYTCGFAAIVLAWRRWRVTIVSVEKRRSSLAAVLLVPAALCGLTAVLIIGSGGMDVTVLGTRVSMHSVANPLLAMWTLVAAGMMARWHVRLRVQPAPSVRGPSVAAIAVMIGTCGVALAPLLVLAAFSWHAGHYASPPLYWRSAPQGIDLATLVLGPPFGPAVGHLVRAAYAALQIEPMEMSGWMGVTAPVLAVLAGTRRRSDEWVRFWMLVAVIFAIWGLGPFLHVAGFNTGMVLPQQFARFVPILGNARMPARAFIVVSLALATLAALWATGRSRRMIAAVCLVAIVETVGLPLPMTAIVVPALYRTLADAPQGSVLELPFGVQDGFGVNGKFDAGVLLFQTIHRHPVAGGYISRLPPQVRDFYGNHEPFRSLLALSAGEPHVGATCADAVNGLVAADIRYVVVDGSTASPAIRAFIARWPLTLLASTGARSLYRLGSQCLEP